MRSKIDKNQVVNEMITTETTYNEALTLMESALLQPEIVGDSDFLEQLSVHVSRLKLISDNLLKNGKESIELDISAEQHTPLRIQRTQLLKSFFQAYKDYAQLFNLYVGEFQSNPQQFNNMNDYLREQSQNKLNFEAHLIMPVQRGPRYSILITEALKNNQHLHPENMAEFNELEQNFKLSLKEINSNLKEDPYWFGKYTYEFFFGQTAVAPSSPKPYQFGDITRGVFRFFKTPSPETVTISEPSSSSIVDIAEEFVPFEVSSSDDESPAP